MSMIERFVNHVSPPEQREARKNEGVVTAEQQDEIVQIFKVIRKGVHHCTVLEEKLTFPAISAQHRSVCIYV